MPLATRSLRTYVRSLMERRYELETLRRSLAMLRPGAPALDREEAMRLVRELQDLERQLRTLRRGLQELLSETDDESAVVTGAARQLKATRFVGSARISPTARKKRDRALPVDQPVIEGQAKRHHVAQGDVAVVLPGPALHRAEGEDGRLTRDSAEARRRRRRTRRHW